MSSVVTPGSAYPEPDGVRESRAERGQRRSVAVLVAIVGVVLLLLALTTSGVSRFLLSNALDEVQLPTVSWPALPVVVVCGLVCLAVALAHLVLAPKGSRSQARARRRGLGWLAALAGVALVVGFVTWAAAGRSPFPVSNQFAGTLALATPLVFGALCGVWCERAGVVNVAIEGQFLSGAFAAAIAGTLTGSVTAALLAAALAGVGLAALLALFAIRYLVNQVVLGVVLNVLAAGVTGFLYDQLIEPTGTTYNSAPVLSPVPIPVLSEIPFLGTVLFSQNVLVYLAVISVALVWFLLQRTTWGLRIRAVGEHPEAADTAGINVRLTRWSAVLTGGVFAGLGGAFFTLASTGAFSKDFTVGNGFIALAALIMGRWHPVRAAVIALFFGFVTQLATQLQGIQTPLPSEALLVLPYVATIVAVAGLVGRVRAPAADGVPYEK